MKYRHLCSLASALTLALGCSLINSPEDLRTEPSSSVGGAPGGGGTSSGGGSGGSGGSAGAATGGNGSGGDAPIVAPTSGLIVMGGVDDDNDRVLAALSPSNGAELSRIDLPVAAIAYDEAPDRYVWFVFTSSLPTNDPEYRNNVVTLEVRRFDDSNQEWTVVSKKSALPPPQPGHLVVLNDRLAYLSYKVVMNQPTPALTLLDTSDLTDVSVIETAEVSENEFFVGLAGVRGAAEDVDAPGGTLDLLIAKNCDSVPGEGPCDLEVQPVFVADDMTPGVAANVRPFIGMPRAVSRRLQRRTLVAVRSTSPVARVEVHSFAPEDPGTSTFFSMPDTDTTMTVEGLDVIECANAGILSEGDGGRLFAFHLTTGNPDIIELGEPGRAVFGEPFRRSALMFSSGMGMGGASSGADEFLRSFEVSESGSSNVVINERSVWNPPDDIVPRVLATRYPEQLDCP